MVNVIPRVRQLVDLLAERGFTPLAAAILRGLDQGVLLPSEERAFETGRSSGQSSRLHEAERTWRPGTREEQAKFVSDIVFDQLIEPLRMRQRSAELLSGIMGAEVTIENLGPESELLPFDRDAASNVIDEGTNLVEALQRWLAAEDEGEVP